VDNVEQLSQAGAGVERLRSGHAGQHLVFVVGNRREVREAVIGREARRQPQTVGILVPELVVTAQGVVRHVALVAVAIDAATREAEFERVAGRKIHGALEMVEVVVTDLRLGVAAQLLARPLRRQQHRATCAVAPEQRSLGPLEHLHVREVVHRQVRALGGGENHLGEIQRHRGVHRHRHFRGPLAAQHHDGNVGAGAPRGYAHGRHVRGEISQFRDVLLTQEVGAHRRDRDRHVLQALLAPTRRDEDFLQFDHMPPAVLRRYIRDHARRGDGERERRPLQARACPTGSRAFTLSSHRFCLGHVIRSCASLCC